jgi:hypothetical protein
MKRQILILLLSTLLISCANKNINSDNPSLDSLISFDTIQTISLYAPEPKFANEKPLDSATLILSETMFMDSSAMKWANTEEPINEFKRMFPKLTKAANQKNWDSTNYNVNELLIVGKKTVHTITWPLGKNDSIINFDGVLYKTDKIQLKKAWSNLDRQIVIKEIYKKDTVFYDLTDFFNYYYIPMQDPDRPRRDKMFIYILK